jgi:hypothetical protein
VSYGETSGNDPGFPNHTSETLIVGGLRYECLDGACRLVTP